MTTIEKITNVDRPHDGPMGAERFDITLFWRGEPRLGDVPHREKYVIATPASAHCVTGKAHYWQIGPPEGPESSGLCRCCGGVRSFKNHFEIEFGDRDVAPKQRTMPEMLVSELWVRRRRSQPELWTERNEESSS